jgi:hypothetical protein
VGQRYGWRLTNLSYVNGGSEMKRSYGFSFSGYKIIEIDSDIDEEDEDAMEKESDKVSKQFMNGVDTFLKHDDDYIKWEADCLSPMTSHTSLGWQEVTNE